MTSPEDHSRIGPWRCFHCDDVFTDAALAQEHFGSSEYQEPGCKIDLAKYREMESLLRRYAEEDTDLHRSIHALNTKHQVELIRQEETGYIRGLKDAMEAASTVFPEKLVSLLRSIVRDRSVESAFRYQDGSSMKTDAETALAWLATRSLLSMDEEIGFGINLATLSRATGQEVSVLQERIGSPIHMRHPLSASQIYQALTGLPAPEIQPTC